VDPSRGPVALQHARPRHDAGRAGDVHRLRLRAPGRLARRHPA
jgi:hypothetical protein